MPKREIGTRIGACSHSDKDFVYLFGYGEYVGDAIPTDDVFFMGERYIDVAPGNLNPKLVLDDGQIVYGCECWWGSEEQIKKSTIGRQIIDVNIADYRRRAKELAEKNEERE